MTHNHNHTIRCHPGEDGFHSDSRSFFFLMLSQRCFLRSCHSWLAHQESKSTSGCLQSCSETVSMVEHAIYCILKMNWSDHHHRTAKHTFFNPTSILMHAFCRCLTSLILYFISCFTQSIRKLCILLTLAKLFIQTFNASIIHCTSYSTHCSIQLSCFFSSCQHLETIKTFFFIQAYHVLMHAKCLILLEHMRNSSNRISQNVTE